MFGKPCVYNSVYIQHTDLFAAGYTTVYILSFLLSQKICTTFASGWWEAVAKQSQKVYSCTSLRNLALVRFCVVTGSTYCIQLVCVN